MNKYFKLTVVVFIVLWGYQAHAVTPGWYGQVGLGFVSYSEDELSDVCDSFGISCSADNKAASGQLGAGYKFNPYFSIEGGWQVLGEMEYSQGNVEAAAFYADGPYLNLVGEVPLGESSFSLLGKGGAAFLKGNLAVTAPLAGKLEFESGSETVPVFGIGGAYNAPSGNYSFRLIYDYFDIKESYMVNGEEVTSPSAKLISLSWLFRF